MPRASLLRGRKVLAAAAVLALLGSCSGYNDARGRGDAPSRQLPKETVEVIPMPDKFSNVADRCDGHGHRVYVTTAKVAPVVIADASCPGGVAG